MAKPTKFEAIVELVGGSISGSSDGRNVLYNSGQTPPSQSDIDAKYNSMVSDWEAQAYARKREAEYPSIQECVHAILDDDLVALQEKRQAVKTKYPKS